MTKQLTASEMGRKGGTNRWAKIPKEKRSEIMKLVRKGGGVLKVKKTK